MPPPPSLRTTSYCGLSASSGGRSATAGGGGPPEGRGDLWMGFTLCATVDGGRSSRPLHSESPDRGPTSLENRHSVSRQEALDGAAEAEMRCWIVSRPGQEGKRKQGMCQATDPVLDVRPQQDSPQVGNQG